MHSQTIVIASDTFNPYTLRGRIASNLVYWLDQKKYKVHPYGIGVRPSDHAQTNEMGELLSRAWDGEIDHLINVGVGSYLPARQVTTIWTTPNVSGWFDVLRHSDHIIAIHSLIAKNIKKQGVYKPVTIANIGLSGFYSPPPKEHKFIFLTEHYDDSYDLATLQEVFSELPECTLLVYDENHVMTDKDRFDLYHSANALISLRIEPFDYDWRSREAALCGRSVITSPLSTNVMSNHDFQWFYPVIYNRRGKLDMDKLLFLIKHVQTGQMVQKTIVNTMRRLSTLYTWERFIEAVLEHAKTGIPMDS